MIICEVRIAGVPRGGLQGPQPRSSDRRTRRVPGPGETNSQWHESVNKLEVALNILLNMVHHHFILWSVDNDLEHRWQCCLRESGTPPSGSSLQQASPVRCLIILISISIKVPGNIFLLLCWTLFIFPSLLLLEIFLIGTHVGRGPLINLNGTLNLTVIEDHPVATFVQLAPSQNRLQIKWHQVATLGNDLRKKSTRTGFESKCRFAFPTRAGHKFRI